MSTRNGLDDEIGPWSEDKLNLLRKYLEAYTKIMKDQPWCTGYHYVDAFAGTGRPRARDEEFYVDGSPRVALSIKWPFHSYTFIEKDPRRVEKLRELEEEFPERTIYIYEGDCNRVIVEKVVPRISYEKRNRGFVFLDPFSMDIEWETLEEIAGTGALEVFLNFPVMAINRTALPNEAYKLTPEQIERNNRFWGTPEWRGDIYEILPTLFGDKQEKKRQTTTAKRLGKLYKKRLEQIFKHVTRPLVMKNSKGVPIYCLMFAGHYSTGAKITRDIFRHYEQLGR